MTGTYTSTETKTSTFTHAKKVAANIAADLEILREACGADEPSDREIKNYELEATIMLYCGHWNEVQYGYRTSAGWIAGAALKYVVVSGQMVKKSDPGGIRGVNVGSASFYSFSRSNDNPIPPRLERELPWNRSYGQEPNGRWREGRSYSNGSIGVTRMESY